MTNPVTPNIGLNKIDRTSPSTTYFDLEKYIDQNADAVDRFAGETNESINALGKRLDTEERREVVLQPGLQIVNAERSAPFKLSGIKGRTLVNLAGRKSYVSNNDPSIVTLNVAVNSIYNNTDTINVDIKNTNEGYIVYKQVSNSHYSIDTGKYYMISADVKINSISGAGQIKVGGTVEGATDADKTKIGVWQRVYHTIKVGSNNTLNIIIGTCYAAGVFATANFDIKNISFYEISQAEDTIFRTLSPEQRNIKYPYVNSVTPVRNPYAIRYGENLLPPFYEWSWGSAEVKVVEPYAATLNRTGAGQNIFVDVNRVSGAIYTFSCVFGTDSVGQVQYYGADGNAISQEDLGEVKVITPPQGTVRLRILLAGANGLRTFKNPMLALGSESKPFKPREDSMLALQTDLFADPLTGNNADEAFGKDGLYFKLAKWKKQTLDASLDWRLNTQSRIGYKEVFVPGLVAVAIKGGGYGSKFDGKLLTALKVGATTTAGDQFLINSDNAFVLAISNTDSGWGDNYSPTADEIKAYFMGWKMFTQGGGSSGTFDGTGSKSWVRIDKIGNATGFTSTTVPTASWDGYTPYQLVYQLATPIVEPIEYEGMLTFNEGDNQIEVGTGIVLRESTKPYGTATTGGTKVINYKFADVNTWLKYQLKEFVGIYRNGALDPAWDIKTAGSAGQGLYFAQCFPEKYDDYAAYSVTYKMLDTSPIAPFSGSYATNEKAMLQELTDSVQQNATAVSVLMNKKVDKDAPGWITPTLLNGWTRGDNFAYQKMSNGMVIFRGNVGNGTLSSTIPLLTLPVGYRPKQVLYFPVSARNGTGTTGYGTLRFLIHPDGTVTLFSQNDMTVATIVWLNNVAFLAEQ